MHAISYGILGDSKDIVFYLLEMELKYTISILMRTILRTYVIIHQVAQEQASIE